MDDKNKYNNALEKLQEALAPKNGREISGLTRGCIEEIFPELKELEDEKIRKSIIENLKGNMYRAGGDYDLLNKQISWLEKQGEKPQGKTALEAVEEEKVDNANKVEPKFHEGEWVVWDNKISCHIDNIYQVKESLMYAVTDTNNMIRTYSGKDFDRNAHLWSIEDAKDGDILVASDESIFIYAGSTDRHAKFYVALTRNERINVEGGNWEDKNSVHPATKEQRDLLFQKMKEAGYIWDAEKKEPKKIKDEFKNYKQQVMSKMTDLVKDSIRQKPTKWRPSNAQIKALEHFIIGIGESGYASPYDANLKLVYSLLNDLKKIVKL